MPRSRRGGLGRELDVRDVLRELGWEANRTAKEKADVIAIAPALAQHPTFGLLVDPAAWPVRGHADPFRWSPLFVQVKSTKAGPYGNFGPVERIALVEAAERCGGVAWLAWWPPRGKLAWIPSNDWPRPRA